MASRLIVASVASLSLAGASLCSAPAFAQVTPTPPPMRANTGPGPAGYVVPIVVGVVLGALVVPMVFPMMTEVAALEGVGGAAAPVAAVAPEAVPAVATPAATATAWTWQSVVTLPVVIGGVAGGLLGYAVAR